MPANCMTISENYPLFAKADAAFDQAFANDPLVSLLSIAAFSLRRCLASRRINAVILSFAARRTPYPLDHKAYRRRNVIERLFCKLKNWHRIATRYGRLATNYRPAIALVAAVIS
jgi:hypothetical protein